jgi:hypothetical protein
MVDLVDFLLLNFPATFWVTVALTHIFLIFELLLAVRWRVNLSSREYIIQIIFPFVSWPLLFAFFQETGIVVGLPNALIPGYVSVIILNTSVCSFLILRNLSRERKNF